MEVNQNFEYYRLFLTSVLACSFAIAFLSGMFIVVTFPHWRRAACASVVVGLPIAIGAVMAVAWNQEAPHLLGWGVPYIAGHVYAQLAGGMAGVFLGRPLARLVVRILLPPGARPRLAYLWLADAKPLPSP